MFAWWDSAKKREVMGFINSLKGLIAFFSTVSTTAATVVIIRVSLSGSNTNTNAKDVGDHGEAGQSGHDFKQQTHAVLNLFPGGLVPVKGDLFGGAVKVGIVDDQGPCLNSDLVQCGVHLVHDGKDLWYLLNDGGC